MPPKICIYKTNRNHNLTAAKILTLFEEKPPQRATDIFILPPLEDEEGGNSDDDSEVEDDVEKDVNYLGKSILNAPVEVEVEEPYLENDAEESIGPSSKRGI